MSLTIRQIFMGVCSMLVIGGVAGQNKIVMGVVIDSATQTPLPKVSICVSGSTHCVLSDNAGKFKIAVDNSVKQILITATSYFSYTLMVGDSSSQSVTVLMAKSYNQLNEVVVNGRRKRYRNKNNPAVELIRQVIERKSQNGPTAYAYSSYQSYEKTRILMDQPPHLITDRWPFKKFKFFFDNIDSTTIPGKKLSAIYLQEILSNNYYQRQPEKKKQVILGQKKVDFGEHADMQGLRSAINRLYEDINIYDNNISAFTLQFLSPIAEVAPTFYMYFIRDTIVDQGVKFIKLDFKPRNPADLLFEGTLYITLDGKYAVRKFEMRVDKNTNLNWVRNIKIKQDFVKGPGDRYHLANSDVVAFFSPIAKSKGMFGERFRSFSNLADTVITENVFNGPTIDTLINSNDQSTHFWNDARTVPLSSAETKVYANTDSLLKMHAYHSLMDWSTFLVLGYKTVGKFDIGQVGNFYSFNPVEGSRVRFGGRSNTKLSTRYFMESYVAYGFRDQQWKYFLSGTYSINHKSIYTFPFNYIQVSFLHDVKNPGQEDLFFQGNAFLSSFNRGYNSNLLYNDIFRFSYVKEFGNHFSYNIGAKYWRQKPSDSLIYVYEPTIGHYDTATQLTVSEFSVTLRWAPHEQFFQNKVGRRNIVNKYPIISLGYAKGISGVAGGQYNYDALRLDVYKRFYLSPFGYTDVSLMAGYLGGNLPFPLLVIHPANQSFFYSYYAYNLMNTEEFVSDHFAGLNLDHYFNGFFLNKIPFLKKLRLREVVAAKILYGGLRAENNPANNPLQMKFPLVNGTLATYELGSVPYIEASVGIYNIFSVIRIDLVKRFTYLDHPRVSTLGLRFSTNFNF